MNKRNKFRKSGVERFVLKNNVKVTSRTALWIGYVLAFLLTSLIIHHYVLLFQNRYCLEIGPGDKGYFNVDRRNEFGIRRQREWTRMMRRSSSIHLPLILRGTSVNLGFEIKSSSRPEEIKLMNKDDEIVGRFRVGVGHDSEVFGITIPASSLPDRRLEIRIESAKAKARSLNLEINRVYINTQGGGTVQHWKYDFYFIILILSFWAVLWLAGFTFLQGFIGTAAFGFLAILGRFLDPLAYMKYSQAFLIPGIPILILSVLLIRFILSRIALFKDESIKIISALFLIAFIIYFIGIFYPYHLNKDGQLRVEFFRLMFLEGPGDFLNEMSRQHSIATGMENEGIPYPPWFNLLALPSAKLGIKDFLWLRFQFLLTNSFYILLIYGLARQMGLSQNTSRLASFFSIFGNGILHNISIFSYDPRFAFTLALFFVIYYFKNAERIAVMDLRRKIILCIILGLTLITHPDILIFFGLFFALAFIPAVFTSFKEKWKALLNHVQIGIAGFALSLILFYGFFFRDLLFVTIPNALNKHVVSGTGEFDGGIGGFGGMLLKTLQRIGNMTPFFMIPFVIYGFFLMFRHFRKKKMYWARILVISWLLVYAALLFLRATGILFNFIKYLPEYEIIYPIVFIALGYSFSELYLKLKKRAAFQYILTSIIVAALFVNLLWFYCYKIGMAPKFEDFLRPLSMFF